MALVSQGDQARAQSDTYYLATSATGTWSELATDLSQYGEDLTDQSTYADTTSNVAKYVMTTSWAVEFDLAAASGDSGALFERTITGSTYTILIEMETGPQTIKLTVKNGANTSTLTLGSLGLPASPDDQLALGVTCEPNLETTGASDASRYWIYLQNKTQATFLQTTGTGYTAGSSACTTLTVGNDSTAGLSTFSGTVKGVRISSAFHTATELRHCFYGTISAESDPVEDTRVQALAPDIIGTGNLGDDGEFLTVPSLVATSLAKSDLRLLSFRENWARQGEPDAGVNGQRIDAGTSDLFQYDTASALPVPANLETEYDGQEMWLKLLIKRPIEDVTTHLWVSVRYKARETPP